MNRLKFSALLTVLVALFAVTAISGCTGTMDVGPTATPTAVPTAQPTAQPTAVPSTAPTATAQATATPMPAPTSLPSAKGPYPTMGPWTPGNDTFVPTPTPVAGYMISAPWVDQKIEAPRTYALKITGNVANPLYLNVTELQGYPQLSSSWTNAGGTLYTGKGPSLNALLDAAKPKPGATSLKLISSDGTSNLDGTKPVTITLATVRSNSNAIVSFEGDGSLRTFIPSIASGRAQLKYLVEIQVI